MLFTTFDGDTRVDPLHARKMAAALENSTTSGRPVLLRHEADVGHGARSMTRTVELSVDTLAFMAAWTGLDLTRATSLGTVHLTWRAAGEIVGVLLAALILRFLLRRIIDRVVSTVSSNAVAERIARTRASRSATEADEVIAERTSARAHTVGQLLKSVAVARAVLALPPDPTVVEVGSFLIVGTAVVLILGHLGVNVAPIVASAGVAGIAIGFGAQSLIKDFLTGVFMIFEDQYGVGDDIDTGQAAGTVERVGLRLTTLRDGDGVLWYIPNGTIQRVGNKSQGWAMAKVDVPVGLTEDPTRIQDLLRETADTLADDPDWTADILDVPAEATIEALTSEAMTIRVQLRTQPTRQRDVARELRLRLKHTLDQGDILYRRAPRALS